MKYFTSAPSQLWHHTIGWNLEEKVCEYAEGKHIFVSAFSFSFKELVGLLVFLLSVLT